MTILSFDPDGVRRLLEHSRAAEKRMVPYDPEAQGEPGLLLVKDSGIYLMSNGIPGLKAEDGSRNQVVYAKGYDPNTDGDVWDACRAAVGGDDFVEAIKATDFDSALSAGKPEITIEVTATTLGIEQ